MLALLFLWKCIMENTDFDLLTRMEEEYKSFSKGQKAIASYIRENYDKAAFIGGCRRAWKKSGRQRINCGALCLCARIQGIPKTAKTFAGDHQKQAYDGAAS